MGGKINGISSSNNINGLNGLNGLAVDDKIVTNGNPIPIFSNIISSFKPIKNFKNHTQNAIITSLDYDDSGQFLISSGIDETLQLYDTKKGKHSKTILSKKYGCHSAKLVHREKNCIFASTKEDNSIKYLSLIDNSFIKYFKGHKSQVLNIELNPIDDQFISISMDNTVRLWDLKIANSQGLLSVKLPKLLAYDPSGLVFAIYSEFDNSLNLYSTSEYLKGAFLKIDIKSEISETGIGSSLLNFTSLEFSNNGKFLLLSSSINNVILLIDSFTGKIIKKLIVDNNNNKLQERPFINSTGNVSITPDSKFIFAGCGDNTIKIWDLSSVSSLTSSKSNNKTSTTTTFTDSNPNDTTNDSFEMKPNYSLITNTNPALLKFNPRYWMFASADTDITFWTPTSYSNK
ncbi:hypothetical protein BVG19_g3579 [[Candida] boidinii]|nr:hypothetical protein BVG19_g3579 [[Candida] boidinii]OWB49598.1 hypothetical protein B5S27_g1139 [[Candida] boidinii]